MLRSLYTAATGMNAQKINVDVIANNLANVNTTGFKRSRADFQDLMYQTMRASGTASSYGTEVPTGIQVGLGVKPVAVQKIFLQGTFEQTENPLDLAIEGDGFFRIIRPSDGEIAYTRAGTFKLDGTGRIVNSDGFLLEPEIIVPRDSVGINIEQDGTVSARIAGQLEHLELGQIELARFVNPAGLSAIGKNLFMPTRASGEPFLGVPGEEGFGTLVQGFLETSNVNVVEEMIDLITAQRAYELNSRSIQASDDMLQTANALKR